MTSRWIPSFVVLAVVSGASSLSGCASEAVFNSRTNLANAAPVKRLLVVANVESHGFNHDMHLGFEAALVKRLSTCGIAAKALEAQPGDLDPAARVSASAKELEADAILMITALGGDWTESGDTTSTTLIFDFKLVDVASGHVTWLAKSQLDVKTNARINDFDSGTSFGTSVVSRLRDDRVLAGCPTATVGWPVIPSAGCLEQRQRALAEAQQVADQRERMTQIASAPDCK
jgi:hypothetical protein